MRTRDVGWSFRHSSRITNLLECVFTLEHCMTHPHPFPAAGVPATPQKSPAVTSND